MSFDNPVTGPLGVAYFEQIRSEARARGHDLGPPVPIDLCVWQLGDSKRRDVTKFGGVPYWPADEPWPGFRYGPREPWQPYTFVAQFCFADSKDILPALPGDILCILACRPNLVELSLHWFRLGERPLLSPRRLPPPGWALEPCHAVLHRTADYPVAKSAWFDEINLPDLTLPKGAVPPASPWDWIRAYPERLQETWVIRYATKLGGVWWSSNEYPDPDEYEEGSKMRALVESGWATLQRQEQEFVCQFIPPKPTERWPFLNVARLDDIPSDRQQRIRAAVEGDGFVSIFYGSGRAYSETFYGG